MRVDVLHVLSSDRRRGAETFGYDLHRGLTDRGVRSDICCLEPSLEPRRLPVPVLAGSRFSPAGLQALRRRARAADVVIAHGSNTLLACGAGLLGVGVPFIYLSIGDPRYWARSRSRRARARWLLKQAAAVVAISPSARDVLIGYYQLNGGDVHVIPNGRSASQFTPATASRRAEARRSLGLAGDADVIATVGALTREKRVDVTISAIERVPGTLLVVAGDGPERSALKSLAHQAAPGRVIFLGATEGSATVLAAADVVVLSSESEGVPGVLIEAGLAGLPVVATDVGWVSDVVEHGRTGLLTPPDDPLLLASALREALDARTEFGDLARKRCLTDFEMEPVTAKWQQLIEKTAGRRRLRRSG